MDNNELIDKIELFVRLRTQIKDLKYLSDKLNTQLKEFLDIRLKEDKLDFFEISKFRLALTHIKQDRLNKDKVVKYVNNTGGDIKELYNTIEFDRLDVIEISDSLNVVNID